MMLMQETLSGEVVSLTDPAEGGGVVGPRPGLMKYKNNQNLRVLGMISQPARLCLTSPPEQK